MIILREIITDDQSFSERDPYRQSLQPHAYPDPSTKRGVDLRSTPDKLQTLMQLNPQMNIIGQDTVTYLKKQKM